jgi:hypothetical protein
MHMIRGVDHRASDVCGLGAAIKIFVGINMYCGCCGEFKAGGEEIVNNEGM